MNLKNQISRKTFLDTDILKFRIISEIKESGYNIKGMTGDIIYFNYQPKGWALRSSQVGKVDKGEFEISVNKKEKTLTLTWHTSLTYLLTLFIGIVLLGIFWDYIMLVMAGCVILVTLGEFVIAKIKSEEMIDRILKNE